MLSWQEILADSIVDPKRKKELADQLGYGPQTLDRWAKRISRPTNIGTIRKLARILPFQQQEMREALQRDFPKAFSEDASEPSSPSWREILADSIIDPKGKRELAKQLGYNPRTLDRWIKQTSRPANVGVIKKLALLLPTLKEALQRDFPDVFFTTAEIYEVPKGTSLRGISDECYKRILHAYATLPPPLREWTIVQLVLQQMLRQIDQTSVGILVAFVQYDPDMQTFLVRETVGTAIWENRQIILQDSVRLESLPPIGMALATGRPQIIQALSAKEVLPESFFQKEHIRSIGVYPVLRGGAAAGGLLLGSAQSDFFTIDRRELIDNYTHLFALAFRDQDFYPLQCFAIEKTNLRIGGVKNI